MISAGKASATGSVSEGGDVGNDEGEACGQQEQQQRGRQQGGLLALPDAILSEVMGGLDVKGLGRASCVCRCFRDISADERLWGFLWEGPLPGGFRTGGKAAHAALWLLVKGEVEQTRVAVCERTSPTRMASRRRVGDNVPTGLGAAAATTAASGTTTGRGGYRTDGFRERSGAGNGGGSASSRGGGGGGGGGGGVAAAGFPVHVSCMAISGGLIAAAAGPVITLWDLEQPELPRARFAVSGHGSVTCLLLRRGTLLAGDNSGYLRSYDVRMVGGSPVHEIRAHVDRVTAVDAFAPSEDGKGAASDPLDVTGGAGAEDMLTQDGSAFPWSSAEAAAPTPSSSKASLQRQRWNHGRGWGEGWLVEEHRDEGGDIGPTPGASSSSSLHPRWYSGSSGGGSSSSSNISCPPPSVSGPTSSATGGAFASRVGRGRGRGRGRERREPGAGTAAVGFDMDIDDSARGLGLGGLGCRTPEAVSWLGKRQGYAGRGQGYEVSDTGAASAAADSLMQQHQEAEVAWQGYGGGGGDDDAGGCGGSGRGEGGNQGFLLLTGSDDGTAKAWDAQSGRCVCVYAGHERGVTCLQATITESYGQVVITGGGDSAVIIWELTTGRCLERLQTGAGSLSNPGGPGPRIGCLQAYKNSIVVGEDRHVSVWSLSRGEQPRLSRANFCEHQRPVRRLDVVGRWIVTCSGDYVIRLWDSKTGLCVRELGTKSGAAITSFRLCGLCLLTTSLFDASVLMTTFSPGGETGADFKTKYE